MNQKDELIESTLLALQGKLGSDIIPNSLGEHCPKCGSKNYVEIDDSEYDDGTQEYHLECQDCGYKSNIDEYDINQ